MIPAWRCILLLAAAVTVKPTPPAYQARALSTAAVK
jgi:hypothetical protein